MMIGFKWGDTFSDCDCLWWYHQRDIQVIFIFMRYYWTSTKCTIMNISNSVMWNCDHHQNNRYPHRHLRAFLELCEKVGGEVSALGPMVDKAFKVMTPIKMLLLMRIMLMMTIRWWWCWWCLWWCSCCWWSRPGSARVSADLLLVNEAFRRRHGDHPKTFGRPDWGDPGGGEADDIGDKGEMATTYLIFVICFTLTHLEAWNFTLRGA